MSSLENAIVQMRGNGMPDFPVGHPRLNTDRIVRYGPKGRAWYRLFEISTNGGAIVVVGAYGYWGVLDTQKIEVDWKGISPQERRDAEAKWREAEQREREKRERMAAGAANRARLQWRGAFTLEQARERAIAAPYCQRKQVEPETCRITSDGTVYVPMMRYDAVDGGTLVGLQKLLPDGTKRFNRNMAKEGAACRLGAPPADGDVLLICEGWATGLSIRMATMRMLCVFVGFDAGNLLPVARVLRARYPESPIVFCADDDWKTVRKLSDGTAVPINPGLEKAHAAARAIGKAWVLRPLFLESERQEKWTDFNDLHAAYGLEALKEQLDVAGMILREPPVLTPEQQNAPSPEAREFEAPREPDVQHGAGGPGEPPPPDEPPDDEPEEDPRERPRSWRDDLQRSQLGNVKPSVHNAVLFLLNDPAWNGVLGYDLFAETVVKLKPPPFGLGAVAGEWTDLDDHRLLLWLSRRIGEPGTEAISKAVQLAAHRNEFNPLRDRLEALEWDETPRLRTWLKDYLGVSTERLREQLEVARRSASPNAQLIAAIQAEIDRAESYLELVGIKWMVAAVARVMKPGCKFDHMLILEGSQGAMKSTTAKVLGSDWYTDARLNFLDKDSKLILQGRWIIEMAELEGMNKAETSETKRFLSEDTDLFRPPYGRKLVKFPRRCIFIGTVNLDTYLKDDSGNRRFWPVVVGTIRIEELRRDVDQLWAEAFHLFEKGTPYWVSAHERHLFEEQQESRFAVDAWEDIIMDFLECRGDYAGNVRQEVVTIPEIFTRVLHLEKMRWDRQAQQRVGAILRRHGWARRRLTTGSRGYAYHRPPDSAPAQAGPATPPPPEDPDDKPF